MSLEDELAVLDLRYADLLTRAQLECALQPPPYRQPPCTFHTPAPQFRQFKPSETHYVHACSSLHAFRCFMNLKMETPFQRPLSMNHASR